MILGETPTAAVRLRHSTTCFGAPVCAILMRLRLPTHRPGRTSPMEFLAP